MANIKEQTLTGVKWGTIDKFSSTAIQFLIGIVLARLLSPEDFGTVGLLSIFFAISNVFADGGFYTAVIRKKELSFSDCCTVFYYNLVVNIICYIVLFFCAPLIADFFHMPILISILRVYALNLIIGAFSSIHFAILTRNVDFKKPAIIHVSCNIISGIVGISLAYNGWGVWALVYSYLCSSLIAVFLANIMSPWHPKLLFSKKSFKELFAFGGNMLLSKLVNTIFSHLTSILIGRFYSPKDLGYYSKGQSLANMPGTFLFNIVGSVTMPILSKMQDDDDLLLRVYRKYIKVCSIIIFYMMFLLFAIGKPTIIFLYGEKWIPSIIFFQIFCLSSMFYHIHAINVNLLLAKGRSDLNLRIEIVKKIISITALIIAIPYGVIAICLTSLITTHLCMFVNTYYTGKLFNFGYLKQWKDFLPYLIISFISVIPAFFISKTDILPILSLIIGGIISTVLYLFILWWKDDEYFYELVRITPLKTIEPKIRRKTIKEI